MGFNLVFKGLIPSIPTVPHSIHLYWCVVIKDISMLGTKFSWSVYHCASTCISGITVLLFSLSVCSCVLLCNTKYVF
jgi:hypothetical protein